MYFGGDREEHHNSQYAGNMSMIRLLMEVLFRLKMHGEALCRSQGLRRDPEKINPDIFDV